VHNLAYQGVFPADHLPELFLPSDFYHIQGLEFYGHISYLKAGLFYSDHVTTVSPTYAKEITNYEFGFGLHGLLKERKRSGRLTGILNGVDEVIWNPLNDQAIAAPYELLKIKGKEQCKAQLQKQMGLAINPTKILFGVVSRLTEQKGLDWVLAALPHIVKHGGQFVLLGSGDEWMQDAFLKAALKNPEDMAVHIGHNDTLAHQFIAGADSILIPSRFEPCGLTQLYALKYGTLPLVRSTGGLADTVVDCTLENIKNQTATGFVFYESTLHALERSLDRVFYLWAQNNSWESIQVNAMKQDFSWEKAAAQYFKLYRNL
jgi:starch synthase